MPITSITPERYNELIGFGSKVKPASGVAVIPESGGSIGIASSGALIDIGASTEIPNPIRRHTEIAPGPDLNTRLEESAAGLRTTQLTPEEEEARRNRVREQMQASIDAINVQYQNLIRGTEEAGFKRGERTRSLVSSAGLLGSARGEAFRGEAEQLTRQEVANIERERATKIAEVVGNISKRADEEIAAEQERISGNVEKFFNIMSKIRSDTREEVKGLATGGGSLDDLPVSARDQLLRRGGFSDEGSLRAFFAANNPQAQVIQAGNSLIAVTRDPKSPTGFRTETLKSFADADAKNVKAVEKVAGKIYVIKNDGTYEEIGVPEDELEKKKKETDIAKTEEETRKLKAEREKLDKETAGIGDSKKVIESLDLVKTSLEKAKTLAHASGRSGIRKTAEGLFKGSTDYTNLVAETNTLRTNVLTLVSDPDIKKFFGPQMSEADVRLMTSAGTTLNPELQSPEAMKEELERLDVLFKKLEKAAKGTGFNPGDVVKVDGIKYRVESDGDTLTPI